MSDEDARAVFGDLVPVYVEGRAPGGEASTVVTSPDSRSSFSGRGQSRHLVTLGP